MHLHVIKPLRMRVLNQLEFVAIHVGECIYILQNPVISGFEPVEGPIAGGTRINITGDYLDTGRNIAARFGDAECIDL